MRMSLLLTTTLFAAGTALAQPAQPPQPAPRPVAMCANAEQSKQAMEYYAKTPGKVMPGEQSTRSNFFNLKPGGGINGHLRTDLMSTIAVVALPGKDGAATRGALFYDGAGESSFAVFLTGEGGEGSAPSPEGMAAFDKTMSLAKSLPKACG